MALLKLPPEGGCIMWQWLWVDDVNHISVSSSEGIRFISPSLESSSARSSSHNSPQPVTLHGVVFKCIGYTCVCQRQDIPEEGVFSGS